METLESIKNELKIFASPEKAILLKRYFKTGKGEYGEGDLFLGLTVPQTRNIAKKFWKIELNDLIRILNSKFHEERLLGVLILVHKYEKSEEKKSIVEFYLKHRNGINNWDLVDQSAYKILGDYCFRINEPKLLRKLINSPRHWDRRIAMVGTYSFIKKNQTDIAFELAQEILNDPEDLMHKASGWMLREAGKRNLEGLEEFIKLNGTKMPRTMLRYAIEKFPKRKQKSVLKTTKSIPTKRK